MSQMLRTLLSGHVPADPAEARHLAQMREAVENLAAPLARSQAGAHFTASAVVVTPEGDRVAMLHHRKLERWLQPGGHIEPGDDGDLVLAAMREAREETGCEVGPHPLAPLPLDVDAHVIPARRDEAEHTHLDVRFLLVATSAEALAHDPAESRAIHWFGWDAALERADDAALVRMLTKARALCER
ncbi:MAG TPA: NUDIX hydrolase [Myxococcaceae bacterium]|nr:NUDIX hydrolase [Myxococcaceae bacterium]